MAHIPANFLSDLNRLVEKGPTAKRQSKKPVGKPNRIPKSFAAAGSHDELGPINSELNSNVDNDELKGMQIPNSKEIPNTKIQNFSSAPENAFVHSQTSKRVAHLNKKQITNPVEHAFLYASTQDSNQETAENFNKDAVDGKKQSKAKDEFDLSDLNVVTTEESLGKDGSDQNQQYPALRPTNRKEVALLKNAMIGMLRDLGADDEQEYPTEMHAFLGVIQEEQKIYDTVLQEIIRQVTINMTERGEILHEVRRRYANMFSRIPRHVRHLHTELVAQRKLNKRLTEELIRAKETVADLLKEVDMVKKHDNEVTKQAQITQEKLVNVLTHSDNTDEILEEYHKLYKLQRDRLEEAVAQTEHEKRIWIEASTRLAMRIGQQHGISELVQLQKFEHARLRAANHMISILGTSNESELNAVEKKIEESRTKLIKLSQSVVLEDQQNIECLAKMERDLKLVLKNLDSNEPGDSVEAEHPLLRVFHIYDVKSLSDSLMKWVEQITSVAVRFTSDSDISFREEIAGIRSMVENWIEAGLKLTLRNERTTNGKDYKTLTETLSSLNSEIDMWLRKIEMRVTGEDGIASHVISLQNQLEDRYTTYSARDFDKPLPPSERQLMKDSIVNWLEQINVLINTLSDTSEKEQTKIPMHIESWLNRTIDQINTDTDIRNEENLKVHTSMISWMVQLLVKGFNETPNEEWDQDFHQLNQEIMAFTTNLLRDAGDLEMMSDDRNDLRTVMQNYTEHFLTIAKRLLNAEKKNSLKNDANKKKQLKLALMVDSEDSKPTEN